MTSEKKNKQTHKLSVMLKAAVKLPNNMPKMKAFMSLQTYSGINENSYKLKLNNQQTKRKAVLIMNDVLACLILNLIKHRKKSLTINFQLKSENKKIYKNT